MKKLKLYSTSLDGLNTVIVATTSLKNAALLIDISTHQLKTYDIDFEEDSIAGKIAFNDPENVYIAKNNTDDWSIRKIGE